MKCFPLVFVAVAVAIGMASCQESLEQRAERETREWTLRHCPLVVSDGVTIDSMVLERSAVTTVHYYFTLSGLADTSAIDTPELRQRLTSGARSNIKLRRYREAGFAFAYTYRSARRPGEVVLDVFVEPQTESDGSND